MITPEEIEALKAARVAAPRSTYDIKAFRSGPTRTEHVIAIMSKDGGENAEACIQYVKMVLGMAPALIATAEGAASLRAELAHVTAERDALRNAQGYLYIGKDGKPKLARDLEAERDAALSQAKTAFEDGVKSTFAQRAADLANIDETARREGLEDAVEILLDDNANWNLTSYGRSFSSRAAVAISALLDAPADGKPRADESGEVAR